MTDRPTPVTTTITPCPDGPLLVRGEFALAGDEDVPSGRPRRNVVALCRCGASAIAPLCDGSHKLIGFHAPGASRTNYSAGLSDNTHETPRPPVE